MVSKCKAKWMKKEKIFLMYANERLLHVPLVPRDATMAEDCLLRINSLIPG